MKKTFLLLMLLAAMGSAMAQQHVLLGTCHNGGASSNGTIWMGDSAGNNIHVLHSFINTDGAMPLGNMVQAPNGNIYGVTAYGGCNDSCVLYEYNLTNNTCTDVFDFYCTLGGTYPKDGLILGTDGNLYGMTPAYMFRFNPNTHVLDSIYTFQNGTGIDPLGRLLQVNNLFYGMTTDGGSYADGVIFSFDMNTHSYSVLHNFNDTLGKNPYYGSLIKASNGKLYGMTYAGGVTAVGVIFEYDLSNNQYSALHQFNYLTGSYPRSSLIQGIDGKLYGMTYSDGANNYGVIFNFDIATSTYIVLFNFDGTFSGAYPNRELMQADNGKLYGICTGGGSNNNGTAFSIDPSTNTFTKLIDFNTATTGNSPDCPFFEAVMPMDASVGNLSEKEFSVFPTSANDKITLDNLPSNGNTINIINMVGQSVYRQMVEGTRVDLDIHTLPNGVYSVIISGYGGPLSRRFVKI